MSVVQSEKFKKNSLQIYNLLKVLNKNKPLENLNNINEVYENQADMIEEIIYYNKFKVNRSIKKDETVIKSSVNVSDINIEENDDIEDENFDATQYINNMKKMVL